MLARALQAAKELKFNKAETQAVAENIMKYAEDRAKGEFEPSREKDELSMGLGNPEHTGRVRGVGKSVSWRDGFQEDRAIYKKHGRNKETEIQRQIRLAVNEELAKRGVPENMSLQQQIIAPQDQQIVVAGEQPIAESQGSNSGLTPIYAIRVPTACTLVVRMGRANIQLEVATAKALPRGDTFHSRPIPDEYTRVEVISVKQEYRNYNIDIPTPEGLSLLGECENQFILWHIRDIILTATSPVSRSSQPLMDRVPEEIPFPSLEGRIDIIPEQREPKEQPQQVEPQEQPRQVEPQEQAEQVEPKEQPRQVEPQEQPQQGEQEVHPVIGEADIHPPEQRADVTEAREKVPVLIRPFKHTEAPGVAKWLAIDRHKDVNKAPQSNAPAPAKKPVTNKDQASQMKTKYPDVLIISDKPEHPLKYKRGKNFLPNRALQLCPRGMKMFHNWYLRALSTDINIISARFPENAFGGPLGTIPFDFDDVQTIFRLGWMESNLVCVWCL